MKRRIGKVFKIVLLASFIFVTATVLALPAFAADTSCKTKYPIILAHGMAFYPTSTWPTSFEGIQQALTACGADVIITTVEPIEATRVKAQEFVDGYTDQFGNKYMGFKQIQALYPAGTKFNIFGHSQGGLYTRDAITNLGIAPYVASLTTADSPHRGSYFDSLTLFTISLISWWESVVENGSPWAVTDMAKQQRNDNDLTVQYMTGVFNPNTPNKAGILYQSFTCAYRYYDIVGTALYGLQGIIDYFAGIKKAKPNPADGYACFQKLCGTFPYTAGEAFLLGGGLGDGLVQVSSAQWGNYLGLQQGPWYSVGLHHFDAVNINYGKTWDAVGYWVKMVKDLKAKGY
jgi:triacylglycerol lipase